MKNIVILTSCINPNTNIFAVGSIKERTNDLVKNINFLISKKIFNLIYVIDSSQEINFLENKNLKTYLIDNGSKINENIIFLNLSINDSLKREIKNKGKGFSEMQMLLKVLHEIKRKYNEKVYIHKISGRYKILNIENLVEKNYKILETTNSKIILSHSNLLERSITSFYTFSSDLELKIFYKILNMTNDLFYKSFSVEKLFYSEIVMNIFIDSYRSRYLPFVDPNLIGGSTQGRLKRRRQIIKNLIYKYL